MADCLINSRRLIETLLLRLIAERADTSAGALLSSSMIATGIFFSLRAIALQLAAHLPQKMFCIHVAGDELGTLTHDFRQNGLPIVVDGCHLDHFDNASSRIPPLAPFSPSRLELIRPLADHTTRRPLLLTEPPTSEADMTRNPLAISTFSCHGKIPR